MNVAGQDKKKQGEVYPGLVRLSNVEVRISRSNHPGRKAYTFGGELSLLEVKEQLAGSSAKRKAGTT